MASNAHIAEDRLEDAPHSKQSLRLWLRLLACTNLIEKRVRNRLRQEFHTTLPRFDVMATLDHAGGPLTMGDLSDRLMVSNGNVTGIVTRLAREGLVRRTVSTQDRRAFNVELTAKGREDFATQANVHEGWIDQMMAGLDDESMTVMLDVLETLKDGTTVSVEKEIK